MKKKFILLPILTATSALTPLAVGSCASYNMGAIRDDYTKIMLATVDTKQYDGLTVPEIKNQLTSTTVTGFLSEPQEAYFFKNINYSDQDKASWQAHNHVLWALQIAVIGKNTHNQEMIDIAIRLANYWLALDYWNNNNWWFNLIGVPRDLSNLALIIYEKLCPSAQNKMLEIIQRGSFYYNRQTTKYTGTNLFWFGDITLKSALLTQNEKELNQMVELVGNEIKEDDNEGFQHDGTYFQHDKILYTGAYGRQGSTFLAKIIASFASKKNVWTDRQLEILTNFIVNGVKYCTHKGQFNYFTMGRTFCRKQSMDIDGSNTDLGNVFDYKYLLNLPNCPHAEELTQLNKDWEEKNSTFSGIKVFPASCMIAMNIGDDVYMSFRGTKPELIDTEIANGENVLGHNLGYGSNTCVMQSGTEYSELSPVAQYDCLPGTTTIAEADKQLLNYTDDDFKIPKMGTFFCGKEQEVGFCMQQSQCKFRDGTEEPKQLPKITMDYATTCIACEDGMVLIGSGIKNDANLDVHTTVEQCILQEAPIFSESNRTVQHGKVLYRDISETGSGFINQCRMDASGNWNRNKTSYDEYVSGKRVFQIGLQPTKVGQYAYTIQPISKQDKKFKLACCTDKIHAVKLPNGKIAAAFYVPGRFEFEGQEYVEVEPGYYIL